MGSKDPTSMQVYCETRLKNMVIRDKENNNYRIGNILKAEILYVLRSYFDLHEYDMDIDISITENGMYHVSIGADCRNIKAVSYIK